MKLNLHTWHSTCVFSTFCQGGCAICAPGFQPRAIKKWSKIIKNKFKLKTCGIMFKGWHREAQQSSMDFFCPGHEPSVNVKCHLTFYHLFSLFENKKYIYFKQRQPKYTCISEIILVLLNSFRLDVRVKVGQAGTILHCTEHKPHKL